MIGEILRVGDDVELTISKESRDAGYNPFPDGTRGVVTGFGEITWGRLNALGMKPGVYTNYSWVRVKLGNESEIFENSSSVTLVDTDEKERREKEWFSKRSEDRVQEKVRDLPETPFWEGDIVSDVTIPDLQLVVTSINFDELASMRNFRVYTVSPSMEDGWRSGANAADLRLIARGNVWKYYHNEPITFPDLISEARFFHRLGQSCEVRNPSNGLFSWRQEEVLAAIREGTAHCFSMFRPSRDDCAQRFTNEELGARVARAITDGFPFSAF